MAGRSQHPVRTRLVSYVVAEQSSRVRLTKLLTLFPFNTAVYVDIDNPDGCAAFIISLYLRYPVLIWLPIPGSDLIFREFVDCLA
jgi:hypothetical protein